MPRAVAAEALGVVEALAVGEAGVEGAGTILVVEAVVAMLASSVVSQGITPTPVRVDSSWMRQSREQIPRYHTGIKHFTTSVRI